jgi:hypothetical protein
VALTDTGREALKRALPYWQEAQRSVGAQLGEDAWLATRTNLSALEELYED